MVFDDKGSRGDDAIGDVTAVEAPFSRSLAKRLGVIVAALPELVLPVDNEVNLRRRTLP